MSASKHFETQAIRLQMERTAYQEHSAPLFLTSSFVFPTAEIMAATFDGEADGLIYSRYSNPNTEEFISKVCAMEGAEDGFATASGMAAVFASIAAHMESGDHLLASRAVFGSTHQLLTQVFPKWGIKHTYVEPHAIQNWEKALTPHTKLLFLETPSNPGLALIDLKKAGEFAKTHDLILMVDNCFATPYLQQPLKLGAHLSLHSGTKWMDGQGRTLGGVIVGSNSLIEPIRFFCRHTGPAMSPFNAWILSKSLETLAVRMDRHCENALKLAGFLETAPEVSRVHYPFLTSHPDHQLAKQQMKAGGGIVAFELEAGLEGGMRFLNALQMCTRSSNLGDTRTIATHPASTTHSKLTEAERQAVGISPGLVRISVGLEQADDIISDIRQALKEI
ncbi:MAG TPA: aminotransferase class I/II-fold pyridoxal phosphate-dependent enzyme [Saprospiraceae bacterium]|nr:aminotransferase class I/II-fold pyridoxal phosphate-dependent enzyme [Saprospiraceae bacterium]HMQ85650.1 aminotransferase class I/II-fold pyridoxal phosphate-dependent enzyme [Saprospiraceae bacterium]